MTSLPKLTRAQRQDYAAFLHAGDQVVTVVNAFVENPGGQEKFFRSQKNEILLFGANNSGKTYCGIMMCAYHIIPEKDRKTGKPTGFTIHPHRRIRLRRDGILAWISSYSENIQQDGIDPRVEKILLPYATKPYKERGIFQYIEFETGRINFKTQTQETDAHKAAKLDFIHADEPHKERVYNEYKSRLLDRKGTIWSTLTPVIDAKSSALRASQIVWYKQKIIDPYFRNPDAFPLRDVIFLPIEENARWTDIDFAKDMFSSMSEDEQAVRLTGMPIDFQGDKLLNETMLRELEKWLMEHQGVSQPEYGEIVFDPRENDDDQRFQFVPTREAFPLEPDMGFALKIWQHPVEGNDFGTQPVYVIGVDPAEGIPGRDYTAVYVVRSDSGEIVAGLHGYLSEEELARQLWKLGWYYSNYDYRRHVEMPALLVIELNTIAQASLTYLIHGNSDRNIEPYERACIYRAPDIRDLEMGSHFPGKKYGWRTTVAHRGILLGQMRSALRSSVEEIRHGGVPQIKDLGWVYDAKHFIMGPTGKYEHAVGFNDDHLFAKALADMGVKQGVYTVPRNTVPERPRKESKILYIPDDYYKNPQGPVPVMFDHEAARESVNKANEQRGEIAWV